MTDEEVQQWLSEKESTAVAALGGCYGAGDDPVMLARTLAETRKALAACEWAARDDLEYQMCPLCDGYEVGNDKGEPMGHNPGCIFATMPRPR